MKLIQHGGYLTYVREITQLMPNEIFVFGSNTQGRHGKGAALWARNCAGAIYGQARGRQGQSYAIVTKDLTSTVQPSRSPFQILHEIEEFYHYALKFPDLLFLVAYKADGLNLNAYSPQEMANFFTPGKLLGHSKIPENIVFEDAFRKLINSPAI